VLKRGGLMKGTNLNNKKRMLYKQKKFLLLNLASIILVTSSVNVSAKNSGINAGITKAIMEEMSEDNHSLYAGVTKKLFDVMSEEKYENNFNLFSDVKALNEGYSGISKQLVKCLTEETETVDIAALNDEMTISKTPEIQESYYDIACSTELQDYMMAMGEKYGFPGEILMILLYCESGGNYNTNGVISETNDYGLAQINKCNFKTIYDRLGFTEDEILNNPYKNLEAAALLISDIFAAYDYTSDNFDYANVFGTYNGWSNWESIESSVNYSNMCMEIKEKYFASSNLVR
jgi:hypothetical protein